MSSYGAKFCLHRLQMMVVLAAIALGLRGTPVAAQNRPVLVFAAASLRNALEDVTSQYQRETGKHVNISVAASPTLARQIEIGAPADIFISADLDWMDYLAKRNLIRVQTRRNLLGNKLVLIAPKDSTAQAKIQKGFPLATLLRGGKLVMAETAAVPAGKYGKAALERLGVWASVARQIAQAENVRAALALVARKEAPLGLVYQSDAVAEPNVKVVAIFPEDSHQPIIYPIAITSGSTNSDAAHFLSYLESPKARAFFEKQGFTVLKSAGSR